MRQNDNLPPTATKYRSWPLPNPFEELYPLHTNVGENEPGCRGSASSSSRFIQMVGQDDMSSLKQINDLLARYSRIASVCGKTPFYDGFKSLDGIRRSGDHVDLGDVRRVIGPSGLQKCG